MRSQRGLGAALALTTCPVNRLTTFTQQLFSGRLVVASTFLFPLPCATAGVAFQLILVAITVQISVRVGCVGKERLGSGERCSEDMP